MSREPINLLLLKGKKHLTKKEIKERREMEVQAPSDNIEYPEYLPENLYADFDKISDTLVSIGIMSNLDTDALARFLIAREQYVKITGVLQDTDPRESVSEFDRVLRVQDKTFNQVSKSAAELGLTISSRARLLVPKQKKEKVDEVAAKFGV